MSLRSHLKYSAAASLLMLLLGWRWREILLFAAGSVLIDFDHYLFYVQRCGRFSVREMFVFHERIFERRRRIPYVGVCIFHTGEFFILMGLVSLYIPSAGHVLRGMVFHFALDLVFLVRNDSAFHRALFMVEHLFRVRKHKKQGYPYLQNVFESG